MHAEIELAVIPRLLGSGVRLFAEHQKPGSLQLLEARPLASGIVVLRYALAPI